MSFEASRAPIVCVVGARPNFMKIAPVIRAMKDATPCLPAKLVHTGQHYDPQMASQFFHAPWHPGPRYQPGGRIGFARGSNRRDHAAVVDDTLRTGGKAGRTPELWDGCASERIVAVLSEWLNRKAERLVA